MDDTVTDTAQPQIHDLVVDTIVTNRHNMLSPESTPITNQHRGWIVGRRGDVVSNIYPELLHEARRSHCLMPHFRHKALPHFGDTTDPACPAWAYPCRRTSAPATSNKPHEEQ
ncbi:uncharacterized protein EAF01_011978 [Botrytis porri]|uniref:uncharacterized protein n=1 Tax=Botrytis porri TaxID=87229 RepID=UPI0019025BB0|nr:uncharacterized protein EAF01_011978 [Botrytis porri]KAF7880709.1 hypothetical protein EAF01_011978 [Botrytis porri]